MQYFLPFATEGINIQIEQAILRADKLGVKVLSLAALNKVGVRTVIFFILDYFEFLHCIYSIDFWSWLVGELIFCKVDEWKGHQSCSSFKIQ